MSIEVPYAVSAAELISVGNSSGSAASCCKLLIRKWMKQTALPEELVLWNGAPDIHNDSTPRVASNRCRRP